jgi:hypothetical protein
MPKQAITIRLDAETLRRLSTIALNEQRSRGALIRNAVHRHYGIVPPGRKVEPPPFLDAPRLNGGAEHSGGADPHG